MIAHVAGANLRAGLSSRSCSQTSRDGRHHIVRRKRPPDPLQLELTHRLDLHGVLDLCQHSRADEDLSGLGLVAQARGDVRYRADSGVVEVLQADGAKRGECFS
jgi:hypothetical protein